MFNYGAIQEALSKPSAKGTYQDSAMMWTEFTSNFAKNVTPLVNPIMEEQGKTALYNTIYLGLQTPGGFLTALKAGLSAYSGFLVQGMLPSFIGTPPTVPVMNEAAVSLGMSGAPGAQVMEAHYNAIALYFQTGMAVPSAGGSPIKWI